MAVKQQNTHTHTHTVQYQLTPAPRTYLAACSTTLLEVGSSCAELGRRGSTNISGGLVRGPAGTLGPLPPLGLPTGGQGTKLQGGQ
eukprot:1157896-Pelagomonas_calceolata.AAC.20